jgi:hypothetical protein
MEVKNLYKVGQKFVYAKDNDKPILNGAKVIEITGRFENGISAKSDLNSTIFIPIEYLDHLVRTNTFTLSV